jgi:hypothetical protein
MELAVVPLMISSGAGAAARASMGLVIFTVLIAGTIFTLFVTPQFYTLISRADKPAPSEGRRFRATADPATHCNSRRAAAPSGPYVARTAALNVRSSNERES